MTKQEIQAMFGTEWQAKVESIPTVAWSVLLTILGNGEQLAAFVGIHEKFTKMQALAPADQQLAVEHVQEILTYAYERIAKEVDSRFSKVSINAKV